ncbi:winged helix-turn-helix domain-containing protein [Pseudocitrobacter cyperus]|uniref:Winged helix-turn-helix domain-containing protein n=1 Tax=Pseudocitrobacter cyperus TaxID=3112843 RepID=A0ABV0HRN0_9ENTR
MKYLLADTLVYDNEDGSLSLKDEESEESQILTSTANQIFSLLIVHHGMVVDREKFLQEVWDERGLNGSNNSLNQYISILRKLLDSMVPETTFIITVPKTGFMLNAEISVQPLTSESSPAPSAPVSKPRARPTLAVWLWIATLIVAAICGSYISQKQSPLVTGRYLLTQIDGCPVYTFTPIADVFQKQAIAFTRQIKESSKLSCLENSVFYVHIQNTLFYGDKGRLVLSQCSRSSQKTSTCSTNYFYEW